MIRKDLDNLPAYVPGARMDDAVKLSSNESSYAPLPSVAKAMSEAAIGVNRYPDMGAVELRTALDKHLGVDFEQTAVGTGSSALCGGQSPPPTLAVMVWVCRGGALRAEPSSGLAAVEP